MATDAGLDVIVPLPVLLYPFMLVRYSIFLLKNPHDYCELPGAQRSSGTKMAAATCHAWMAATVVSLGKEKMGKRERNLLP